MIHNPKSIIQDSKNRAIRSALIIALAYAFVASMWIILSDLFVEQFLQASDDMILIQRYKGLGFVLITASSLFGLLFRYFRRFIDHENQLRTQGKKLRESENLYRRLVETSRDLIWSLSADGQTIFINDASREIFGREPNEMIGRQYHDFGSPDQTEANPQALEIALRNNDCLRNFQNDIRHKDGQTRTLSTNALLIRDKHGQVIGSTGVSRDITEHLKVTRQLEQAHVLLKQTFASLTEAVFVIDTTDRNVVTCNSAVEQIFGYTPKKIHHA